MRVLIKRIFLIAVLASLGCGVKSPPTPYAELPENQPEKASTPENSSTSENK